MKTKLSTIKVIILLILTTVCGTSATAVEFNKRSGDRFDLYSEAYFTNELGIIGSARLRYDLMTDTPFQTFLGFSFEDQLGSYETAIVEKTGGSSLGMKYQLNSYMSFIGELKRKFNKSTNYDASQVGIFGGDFRNLAVVQAKEIFLDTYYEVISVPSLSVTPVALVNSKLGVRNKILASSYLDLYSEIHLKHSPDHELGRSEEMIHLGVREVSIINKFVLSVQVYQVLFQTSNYPAQDIKQIRGLLSVGGSF